MQRLCIVLHLLAGTLLPASDAKESPSIANQRKSRQLAAGTLGNTLGGQSSPPGALGGQSSPPGALGGQSSAPGALGGQSSPLGALGGQSSPPGALGGQSSPPGALGGQGNLSGNTGGQGNTFGNTLGGQSNPIRNPLSGQSNQFGNPLGGQSNQFGNPFSGQSNPFGNPLSGQSNQFGNPLSGKSNPFGNPLGGQSNQLGNPLSGQSNPFGNPLSGQSNLFGNPLSGQSNLFGNPLSGQSNQFGNLLGGQSNQFGNPLSGQSNPFGNPLGGQGNPYGNLLTGPNGLLGGALGNTILSGTLAQTNLGRVLNAVGCLADQISLRSVLQLLDSFGVDTVLGLNNVSCVEGGSALLSILVSNKGPLPLATVKEMLCLIKTVGLREVLTLLNNIGIDKVLGLRNITCANGVAALVEGSSAAAVFEQLLSLFNIDIVTAVGVAEILKLDRLLVTERIRDTRRFFEQVLCLVNIIGLNTSINIIEVSGVSGLMRLNELVCRNSTNEAAIKSALNSGVDVRTVLPLLLRILGLDILTQLVYGIGIDNLLRLGGFLKVNGTILIDDLSQALCLTGSVGIRVLIGLLNEIDRADVFGLYSIICPNGRPLGFPPGANPEFLIDLLRTCRRGTPEQCLKSLDKAFTDNGQVVCLFCKVIRVQTLVDECDNFCATRG